MTCWIGILDTPVDTFNRLNPHNPHRITIILVDFLDAPYTSDAPTIQAIKDRWMNEIINGINIGGRLVRTASYYLDVSYKAFILEAQEFGPFHLPFATYFEMDSHGSWAFKVDV